MYIGLHFILIVAAFVCWFWNPFSNHLKIKYCMWCLFYCSSPEHVFSKRMWLTVL